ncbi:MAG: YceD family protein [Novosphingobium sp.]
MSEFTRMIDPRLITAAPVTLVASPDECKALAARFGIVAVDSLEAEVSLEKDGPAVSATGRLTAAIVQSCAVSGEDLPVSVDEPIALRFVPDKGQHNPDEEVELDEDELDEIAYSGSQFDLGEEVAQSLALAIDPYLTGPNAEAARRKAGIVDESASGPFAALAALRGKAE